MAIRTDLYEILGVTPAATEEEVSRAYHLQLRRHHPDTRSDAPNSETAEPAEAIRVLVEAYAVLRDPVRAPNTTGDEPERVPLHGKSTGRSTSRRPNSICFVR